MFKERGKTLNREEKNGGESRQRRSLGGSGETGGKDSRKKKSTRSYPRRVKKKEGRQNISDDREGPQRLVRGRKTVGVSRK